MAYTLPVGFSFVGATPTAGTTPAATNQYGFAAGSLNFQPASDFAAAPKVTTPATPVAPVAPTSVASIANPAVAPTPDLLAEDAYFRQQYNGNNYSQVRAGWNALTPEQKQSYLSTSQSSAPAAAPVVTAPTAAPTAAPKTYSLPPGFSFKTPAAPAPAPGITPLPVVAPSPADESPTFYQNIVPYDPSRGGTPELWDQWQRISNSPATVETPSWEQYKYAYGATNTPPPPRPVVMPPPDRTMPIQQAPTPAPVVTPLPVVTPAPTPAPVVTPPVAKPPVTTGPVAPATPIKTPTMTTTTPKPPVVDPLTAAVKNQGYTDAQIKAAGGAQALLRQVNTKTSTGGSIANPTAAVNYTWADLNKAVGSLQKVNPNMSIQGIPLSKWSTNGVASLAKTDPAIFKALQSYLPKY